MGKFSIGTSIEFAPGDRRALSMLLSEIEKTTKAELPKIIRNAGRDFSRSAISVTPVVKKKIKVRTVVVRDKAGKVVLRGGKPIWIPVKNKFSITPKGRGYAKAGWVKAMLGLGINPVSAVRSWARAGALQHGHFVNGLKQKNPFVEIGNKIPYIEELDRGGSDNPAHHIMSKALSKTIVRTEQGLENAVQIYERRWRRVRFT